MTPTEASTTPPAAMSAPASVRLPPDVASAATVMALAGGGAILLSTQYFAQPFVWRNWTLDVVLVGWLHIVADRLLVAAPVGLAVWLSMRLPTRRSGVRITLTGAAVVVGAVVGELLRFEVDPFADRPDAPAILGRILNWILVSAAGTGIIALWRRGGDLATIAAETGAADARARRMLLASELEGLQRQIEPHFLFNTLATIKSLGRTAPRDADTLLERLFDYLSRIFAVSSVRSSTLGAELDLVTAYLDVCATRMGARLTIIDSIDPSLRACDLPPLMLGTLVENAVRHGLAPLPRGGTITLSAQVIGGELELCVADDGIGLAAEGGAGIGLANLAARLRLLHGGRASLRLEPRSAGGVLAILRLPYAAMADAPAA